MKINRFTWGVFVGLAVVSLLVWFRFSYSQLAFINLSVDRTQALSVAQNYLRKRGEDVSRYQTAVVFTQESRANRYLQRTMSFDVFKRFIEEHDFDMFFWIVRFFRVEEKEEYRLTVSSSTGEVMGFTHIIDDSAKRSEIKRDDARVYVKEFLQTKFNVDFDEYASQGDLQTALDNRNDYSFSWLKKDVKIPWSDTENSGIGKLLVGAKISGTEILSFTKNSFLVPDQFNRDLARRRNVGQNLSTITRVFYYVLFIAAVFFVVVRRNHLAMHTTKRFYIGVAIVSLILSLLAGFNQFQYILFNYRTTVPLESYLWRLFVDRIINAVFLSVAILMPSLSGELLHYEIFKDKPRGSFLTYIRSTFLSRGLARSIGLGYLVFIIMLGIQSVLVKFGQTYWGVWVEHSWVDGLSTAYLPFLGAVTLGFKASVGEEIMFRLFAISWGKKVFDKFLPKRKILALLLAVLCSSLIWGFSHSGYPVFPAWFRGVEVTCLGFFAAFIYLRYGLITIIVAHYLFDVFWHSSGYLLGQTTPSYFLSSFGVLILPLMFAGVAFYLNRSEKSAEMRWQLNAHQQYNLEVLKTYLSINRYKFNDQTPEEIKKTICSHGWDIAVVEFAMEYLEDIRK